MEQFVELLDQKGGFISAHWERHNRNRRGNQGENESNHPLYPFQQPYGREGTCILTGKPSTQRVLFANSLLKFLLYKIIQSFFYIWILNGNSPPFQFFEKLIYYCLKRTYLHLPKYNFKYPF